MFGSKINHLFLLIICLSNSASGNLMKFTINKTWNGEPILPSEELQITLGPVEGSDGINWTVKAPYYDNPAPSGPKGQPFYGLWEYEVSEVFFLNGDNQYVEVEMGPHGQHIVLLLNGERNTIKHSLPLDVTTDIVNKIWTGTAIIPSDYLPPNVNRFNAYHIHGVEKERRYMALYPTDGSTAVANFHDLSFFKPIDISPFVKQNTQLTQTWIDALKNEELSKIIE